ncbi:T9SS type A sorting domain-containing protein [Psychroflexus sp. S27]|uniref:T9SS type A sorting domain-containing protein n=1 Tax=Psychroflexus sp. S27 TaxID=1982757 RepID=UPI00186455AA|nr:T9SS type A sorting domain-containing protein [Psychroflexus sp. S27]
MKSIITCFTFLTVFITQAQWTTDIAENTLVAQSEALDMQAKGTSDGMTYVVFWKDVEAPVNIELRMQVLDANGNQMLGSDGVLVSDQIPMNTYTVIWNIVVDNDDNLYIGVTGTGQDAGEPAYAFKMDTEGNHLWGSNGLNVGNGNVVTVLPLSSGNVIVSWIASTGAVMQKYDSTGGAVWPSTKPIESGAEFTSPANFFELSNGDYVAVFHTLVFGENSNLWAQRYDIDGNPMWTKATQLSDRATVYNRSYTGVQDGDVIYMGYFASVAIRFDSYVQRINPDGTIPWGINGADFDVEETDYELDTQIAFEPGSQYVWAISTFSNEAEDQYGEYVQKFDKETGTRQFTDNAKVVFPIGSDKVHAGGLQLKNGSPLFLNEEGEDNGGATPTTLNSVHLDENGDFAWTEETISVAAFSANKRRVQYTIPVNNQSVAVFVEDKGDGSKVYAQNVMNETLDTKDFDQAVFTYKNPVQNEITLNSTTNIKGVSIYNMLGKQVFNKSFPGNKTIKIDVQSWRNGIYIMKIKTENKISKSIKLIKK